ncbi:MAG: TolC family protein [Desulfobacteraceae bacterium]|nr:TolC family protein [Desulfobacteraceae bacterium]
MKLPVVIGLVMVLLAGCATYRPRPLEPAWTAAAFEARTLDNPGLKKFLETNLRHEIGPWPLRSWDFQTLTLAAFYYHPDLDVARARWGTVAAGKITAGERPNPTAGFTPEHHSEAPGGISSWTLGFNLDIPIETAGKRGYRLAQADHLSEAARLNIATAAWQVRSRLEAAFFDLFTAGKTEALLQREETVQAEIVRLLENRLSVGDASLPDMTQARIALEQTRLLLVEARKQKATANAALASAIGVPLAAMDGIHLTFNMIDEAPPSPSPPDVRRQALLNRPDLLALLAEYEAAQAALRLEVAKQYPDLHLGPGYQWDQGDNKWSLGFSVTLPLFNRNEGPIAEAEARRAETAARFVQLQAGVIGEMDQALAGYRASLDKLGAADAILSARKAWQNSVAAQFKAGEADRLTLTSAQLELETAALARLETFSKTLQARRALEDALQCPLTPAESLQVNVEVTPRPEKEHDQ